MVKIFKKIVSAVAVAAMTASLMPTSLAVDLETPIGSEAALADLDGDYSTTSTAASSKSVKYTKPATAYSIEFDMTINTPLRVGTTSKNDRNSFSIGLFSTETDTTNKGGFMIATGSTANTVSFTWHSGDGSSGNKRPDWVTLNIGTTYKMRFDVSSTNALSLTALDSTGENTISKITGLPLRNLSNASGLSYVSVLTQARQNGQEDSVTIENARIYAVVADAFELSFDNTELSTTDTNTITYDGEELYPLTKKVYAGENEVTDITTELSSEDLPTGIAITDEGLTVADTVAPGTYNFTLKATFTDYPETVIEYPMQVVVPEPDPDEILNKAADKLVIDTTQGGVSLNGDESYYNVWKTIKLPTTTSTVHVAWRVSEKNEETGEWKSATNASVSSGNLTVTPSEQIDGRMLKLTATMSYGDVSKTKDFDITLRYITTEVIYDEDFTGISTGVLVDLSSNSNTTYSADKGITFGCGSRSEDTGQIGIKAPTDDSRGTYVDFYINKYAGSGYTPSITLTRSQGTFLYGVHVSADVKYAATGCNFIITDTANNTLSIAVPDEKYLAQWLNVSASVVGTRASIVIKDSSDKVIYYGEETTKLKNVKSITTTDMSYSSFAIDNLYVADTAYVVPDSEIVEAAKNNIDLDLTKKSNVYQATTDFVLPGAPTGTAVSWKAMQKAKSGGDWEDSQFIAVSGSTAVIKPTDVINDYDVKLVAEITSGEATDTKDFAIALPNPMDEINGILNNNFNIVNTTDTDAESKVITFDLNGTDMLKRDLVLPLSVKSYKNTTIAWTSSDEEHVTIDKDGIATLMTSDFSEHEVKLTAVITYKKNEVTYSSDPKEFTVKMGFEEADAKSDDATMGKYRVRYDAAYDDNFKDIPEDRASSDISLPTVGHFGSTFKWTSSAPTVISNAGKVTKPSTTKTVDLTADIISGSASTQASFKVEVRGSGSGSSGGGGGGGGGTASSTGTINRGTTSGTISTPTSTVAAPASNASAADNVARLQEEALASNDLFTDIPQAAWARDAINGLAKAGVVNGKTDTEFYPNDTVTRAEFAKMLMGAFGLASDAYTTSSFYDVPVSSWYFRYVESAYNLSIIQGTGNGIFEPDALITRQDMAVMVARAALIAGKVFADERAMISFADNDSIAYYATEAVEQLVKAGKMNGMSDTEFAPLENATRAQAAQILFNVVG